MSWLQGNMLREHILQTAKLNKGDNLHCVIDVCFGCDQEFHGFEILFGHSVDESREAPKNQVSFFV